MPGEKSATESSGRTRRLILASLGVLCVGLALVGVFVPGLPTTIFLIAASYLFTRSSPWLEDRLFRLRVFRPFLPYVRGERELSRRARVLALIAMWAAVATSIGLLALGDRLAVWFVVVVPSTAAVGTYFVLTARRRRPGLRETSDRGTMRDSGPSSTRTRNARFLGP